jgi:hypothetical protein
LSPVPGKGYSGARAVVRHAPHVYTRQGVRVVRHAPQVYSRRSVRAGAHYRRHRKRRPGYTYYYGGWWYEFPWWQSYYSGDYCGYRDRYCGLRWGFGTSRYYRCMRYYGCD